MGDYMAKLEPRLSRVVSMGSITNEQMKIANFFGFLSLLPLTEYTATIMSIRTLREDYATWKYVAMILKEDQEGLMNQRKPKTAVA